MCKHIVVETRLLYELWLLCDLKFSCFDTIPACDRETDTHTYTQTRDDSIYRAIASRRKKKTT